MNFVYAFMWLIVGLILIFRMAKENKVFYIAGGFFLLLGGWWLADALMPEWNLFEGVAGIVLRVITAVALVLLCRVMFLERKKHKDDPSAEKEQTPKKGSGKYGKS